MSLGPPGIKEGGPERVPHALLMCGCAVCVKCVWFVFGKFVCLMCVFLCKRALFLFFYVRAGSWQRATQTMKIKSPLIYQFTYRTKELADSQGQMS